MVGAFIAEAADERLGAGEEAVGQVVGALQQTGVSLQPALQGHTMLLIAVAAVRALAGGRFGRAIAVTIGHLGQQRGAVGVG